MKTLIKHALLVNEGKMTEQDLLIDGERIERIDHRIDAAADEVIEAGGKILIPGVIDDQVHFREPGLTHKGDIASESRAALLGGITSYMEMPNVNPATLTNALLEEKFAIAAQRSPVNHSFYMGTSQDNLDEIEQVDPSRVCGVKIFMGASTGNMLVDDPKILEAVFSRCPILIATHCEDTPTIIRNEEEARARFGEDVPFSAHPDIRSREACLKSSSMAVSLARKHGTRLHVLHLTTADELSLFDSGPRTSKKITAEVCTHHLWFARPDYAEKGSHIKWNPAIKEESDRAALRQALKDGILDCVATDHAPHTLEEKSNSYFKAPAGGPLVQFHLQALLDLWRQGEFALELIIDKACHAPADLYQVKDRGYLREGYFADLVLIDPEQQYEVERDKIVSKCGWSPFEGHTFSSSVDSVWVNGVRKVKEGKIQESVFLLPGAAKALVFNR